MNGETTCYLEATDYGFNIPAAAIITGIEVQIEKRTNSVNPVRDSSVQIIQGASLQGVSSEHANVADWPGTDSIFTYGGPGDLWGTTWTVADINANNFGVAIQPISLGQVIWLEDFEDLAVGDEVDNGATSWYTACTAGPAPPNVCGLNDPNANDYFQVRNIGGNLLYEGREVDAEAVWTSDSIVITSYTAGVNISIDLSEANYDNASDWVEAYYKLDGGPEIALTNGLQSGNFNNAVATATGLIGDTLEIVIKVMNQAGNDRGRFDNVMVVPTENITYYVDYVGIKVYYDHPLDICNDFPEFNNFPPIFVCLGDTLKFDHSAEDTLTDSDGDSLVYSMCTPYDNTQTSYGTTAIPGGGTFTPPTLISWSGVYAVDYQLSGDTLVIDPVTGEMTGYPTILGQYLLGVCVSEYRNDTLVNQRDFQFNVIDCVPIIAASVPSPTLPCGGTSVTFQNDSAGAITYDWDFGVPVITTDTSTQATPTYVYPDTGTYTVTLIINQGMTCVDTGTAIVDLHPAVTAIFSTGDGCIGDITSFFDSSTTTFGSIISWSWDFGDGNTSTAQNPTHTYADTGTYTVTFIPINDSACADTMIQLVTISPMPIVDPGTSGSICIVSSVPLSGSVQFASGGTWTTSGTGTFTPSADSLTTTYDPSPADTSAGSVTLTLTSTGNLGNCPSDSQSIVVSFNAAPTADAGSDLSVCADSSGVQLNGSISNAGGGVWSTSGTGTFSPDSVTLNATYAPSAADTVAGTVQLVLTTTGNGLCNADSDTTILTITPAPSANAGPDDTVCADNSGYLLSGSVSIATGGIWSSSGTGSFDDSSLLAATYAPSAGDTAAGSVTLTLTTTGNGGCNPASDQMVLNLDPAPKANAGGDTVVCSDNGVIPLAGTVIHAGGGIWTTSGTGSFDDATLLNATYTASSADTASSGITLTLTSTGNGLCGPASDSMNISFFPGIFVSTSADTSVCLADSSVLISGTVTGSTTTGQWSSPGNGTFSPSDTALTTTYFFTATEMQAGSAILILASTGNGSCAPTVDSMLITIIPEVDAGPDTIVCNTADTIQLNGIVGNISVAQWTASGTGIFVPSDTVANAQYVLTPADIAAGTIGFQLTSSDTAGLCPSGSDSMLVTITSPATATAGADATVCEDTSGYALVGTLSNATGSLWSSSGSGLFLPVPDSLSVTYVPDTAGVDTIVLSATGSCNNASDTVILTITPIPIVNAGADTSVCATILNVPLAGSISTATGGIWSTVNGTGTFTPSDTSMNPTYNGTASDTAAGTINIVLTSTGNGDCNAYTDTINLTYTPSLISVNAGADTVVCNSTSSITLNGTVFIATGGTWSSSGTGTFSPSADSLSTTYIPSAADTVAGSLTLTLTTTGNGGCASVSDDLLVSFFSAPTVIAGSDTTVCFTTDTVFLSGSITNAGGAVWSTSGTGTFTPNDSSLNAGYIPSTGDFLNETVTLYLSTYQSCFNAVDSIRIDIVPGVMVITSDTILCNDADTLPVSGIVTGAAGGIWATNGSGTFFPDDTSMNTNYVLSSADSAAGAFVLTLTTTGVLMGCPPATDLVNVSITPPPTVDAGQDVLVCSNVDSVELNGSTTNAGGVWSSSGSGVFVPDSVTLNATYILSAGDTSSGLVVLTLTTTGSCMELSDSVTISISSPPAVDFNASDVCLGEVSNFTDITPGTIVGWDWDFGDLNTSTNANPQNTYTAAGTYNVTLVVVNQTGCSDSITKPVTVNPSPILSYDWSDVCSGDTMYFINTSSIPAPDVISGYSWDFGDGTTSNLVDPNHVYQNNGIYIVTLTATSGAGCTSSWDTIVVVSPNPVAQFNAVPTLVSTEEQIDFTDLSLGSPDIPDTIDISSWEWNFYYPAAVTGGSATGPNPSYFYGDTGTYTVQLVVTNEYGCTDTAYEDIQVILTPVVASGFSPDGSGADGNNILVVHGGPYQKLKFIIYNEWGEVIFESNSQDLGWDGTFEGVPQPIGVYVYTVIATSLDGVTHHFWGDVTLLR